jgi:hypothetical protein
VREACRRHFRFYAASHDASNFRVSLLIEAGVKDMTHLVDGRAFRDDQDLRAHLARVTGDEIVTLTRV